MPNLPSPSLLDVTIRDGSFLLRHQFPLDKTALIIQEMAKAGINWIEVGHGMGIGAKLVGYPGLADDYEMLEVAKESAPNAQFSVFIQPAEYSLPVLPGLISYMDLGRIGYKPDAKESIEKIAGKLKKYGKKASLQLTYAHHYSPEALAKVSKWAADIGIDIIYLVDSFGSLLPKDTSNYIQALKSEVNLPIGFHGHNSLGTANANTLAAWNAGAEWLDASLMGVGRGSGNTVLESLVASLHEHNVANQIQLSQLCRTSHDIILPLFQIPPHSRLLDILLANHKVSHDSPEILELLSFSLHIPLDELIVIAKAKAENSPLITDAHLKDALSELGFDYEQLIASFKGP